jgi:hypothetical protein
MLIAGGGGGASSTANGTDSNASQSKYFVRGNDINAVTYALNGTNGDAVNAGTGGTVGVIGSGLTEAYGVPPDAFQPYQHGGWSGGAAGKGICGGGGGNSGQGGGAYNTRGNGNSGDGGYNFANNRVTVALQGSNDITTANISTLFPNMPSSLVPVGGVPSLAGAGEAFVVLAFLTDLI